MRSRRRSRGRAPASFSRIGRSGLGDGAFGALRGAIRQRVYLLWIALAALLAVLPLLLKGVSCGHDLGFHLLNWMEVGAQWRQGTLRPFWCFHAAWNAGEPRFVFYPPASWVLGALLGWVLPWGAVPVAFTFVTLVLCGWAMHRLLRRFVSPAAAVLGAGGYLANPYMLFVAYERGAYAELLAAAWMPLLLLALLRVRMDWLRLSVVVAALWLTNAPAAVVGSYSLLVIALVRCSVEWRSSGIGDAVQTAGRVTGGYLVGLAAAGFYLVPAVVQRRLVQVEMAVLPGMRPVENFLFAHTGEAARDAVLRTASWIATGVLTVAAVCAVVLFVRGGRWTDAPVQGRPAAEAMQARQTAVICMAVLTAVVAVLLTPLSSFVWRHAPELTYLQFPWRFLVMEAAVAVALLAFALPPRMRTGAAVVVPLVFAVMMSWVADARFRQACEAEDSIAVQRQHFVDGLGSEPTDEYTPVVADNDALGPHLPMAWLTGVEDGAPSVEGTAGVVTVKEERSTGLHVFVRAMAAPSVSMAAPHWLVVRLRQFRGWHAFVDGDAWRGASARDDGLFAIPLAVGAGHEVELRYERTSDEWGGIAISLGAFALLLAAAWRRDVAALRAAKAR